MTGRELAIRGCYLGAVFLIIIAFVLPHWVTHDAFIKAMLCLAGAMILVIIGGLASDTHHYS
jgi:peptidoglycan/LPS O-acetylase OafA/YrhL